MEQQNKRYYVEVLGVEDKQQLLNLGIGPEHIIELGGSSIGSSLTRIEAAIFQVLGVDRTTIIGSGRNRYACMARVILVHEARQAGMSTKVLAQYMRRNERIIPWYEQRYHDAMRFDKEMKEAETKVKELLM